MVKNGMGGVSIKVMKRQELIEAYKRGLRRGMQLGESTFMGKDIHDFQIPTWAMNYLVNGDDTGLYEDELEMAQEFEKKFDVLAWGEDEYFCSRPAFGPSCEVVDCECVEK